MPEFERESSITFGVFANIHGWQFPQLFLRVDAKVRCSLLEPDLGFNFLDVVEAKRIEAVRETVFVKNRGGEHCIDDATIDGESTRVKPPGVVCSVVHDFVGRRIKDFLNPSVNKISIEVPTPSMSHRVVSGPSINSDSVTNNIAITPRPSRAH